MGNLCNKMASNNNDGTTVPTQQGVEPTTAMASGNTETAEEVADVSSSQQNQPSTSTTGNAENEEGEEEATAESESLELTTTTESAEENSTGSQQQQPNTLANQNVENVEREGAPAGSEQVEPTTTTSTTENGGEERTESQQTEETTTENHDNEVIMNGDEAPVSFGDPDENCRHLLYCGRNCRGASSRCGPNSGRQCTSCEELQRSPSKRMEMLRLIFPTLTEDIVVAALREKRGDTYDSAQHLIELNAPHVPLEQAFPRLVTLGSNETAPLRVVDAEQVTTIQTMMQYNAEDDMGRKVVESALRRQNHRDPAELVSAAIEYLFDTSEETLQQHVIDDASRQAAYDQEQAAKAVERKELLDGRDREIERVKQLTVPDAVLQLAVKPFEAKPTSTTTDDYPNGHCMVQYPTNGDDNTTPFCRICACQPPNRLSGTSLCRTCGLCEGCLSSDIVFHCPTIGNGCHLHHHPLQRLHLASSRRGNRCNVRGAGCLDRVVHHGRYVCNTCDFNVCKNCISKGAPANYDRLQGKIIDPSQAPPQQHQNTHEDESDDESNSSSSNGSGFDASERAVAAQWEGMQIDDEEPAFVLGTGQVAMRAPTRNRQGSSSDEEVQRTAGITGRVDTKTLKPENSRALETFSNRISTVACDIHHVEHLLLQAQETTTGTTNASSNVQLAIREAVTAGKVGIAGTLLLANQYAPKSLLQKRKSVSDADDRMVCFCGSVVDPDTAPDGAVGCLNGHGMHAGCAADHILGGGGCPFCNSPLFFPNIPTTEVEAAKALARTKLEERRKKIETETKTQNEELSAKGVDILPKLNDIVRISSNVGICAAEVTKHAERCGWNQCMKESCGRIGRVSHVIGSCDVDKKQVACRVHINKHQDYFWTPSVLTVICRADSNEYLLFDEANAEAVGNKELVAAAKAENHISHLQAELKVLVAARLELEDTTKSMASANPEPAAMETTADQPSLLKAKGIVSHFDWCRAKHLLRLTDQWGDAEKATNARQSVNAAVCEGDIDSASRIVRRYNAIEVGEDLQWKDAAASEGKEYLVERFAKVDLLAWPSFGAPKTGYCLEPSTHFFSRSEITDNDGNLWVQVDDTLLAALPKYEGAPPPQGWICTRPGGSRFPALVRCARSALRCFGCGDGLVPVGRPKKYFDVKPDHKLSEGDELLVAATLEPVQVVSLDEGMAVCSFSNQSNSHQKKQKASLVGQCNFTARYRRDDLVYPGGREGICQNSNEERVLVEDCPCSRRELISKNGCVSTARKVWENAKEKKNVSVGGILESSFASCVRGHLLHARCFQAALLAGQCCPAAGCAEPLWVPRVRRVRADDDTCCDANSAEADGDEIAGQTTFLNSRSTSDSQADLNPSAVEGMKMCPLCYSGPFVHTECSDMAAHHGQCVRRALGETHCGFAVPPGEIATKLMGLSPNESIVAALPKCPEHKVPVMFNGCVNCGHLFTSWDDLPVWDPAAKAAMNVDKEKREQAKLLADHIREESSILQFDRDALENTWGKTVGQEAGKALLLPPVPPPPDDFL